MVVQFTENVKESLIKKEVKYCATMVDEGRYFYIGMNKDFVIIEKHQFYVEDYEINKHNKAGSKKQALKRFCENNDKIYIATLIISVDDKIKNIEYLKKKFKRI